MFLPRAVVCCAVSLYLLAGEGAISLESICAIKGASTTEQARAGVELRSAYLVRNSDTSGRVALDREIASLQRHFELVVRQLTQNTAESIETALDRLSEDLGQTWTTIEREKWRGRLSEEREKQITRLKAYRDAGTFPHNEGHAKHAVPIFVDRHDTACAVGHLMRMSGWEEEVKAIAAANNLVFVPDVTDGPLVEWVLLSGLTQEEAALIQPSYFLLTPDAQVVLGDLLQPGAVLERDGLRYSNFEYDAQNFVLEQFIPPGLDQEDCDADPDLCPRVPTPTNDGTLPDPAGIGVGAYQGEYVPEGGFSSGEPYGPNGTHWIVFGAKTGTGYGDGWINSATTFGRAQMVNIEFDVTTILPHTQFTGGHIADEPSICFGCGRFPSYAIEADFSAGASELGTLRIDQDNPGEFEPGFVLEEQSLSFAPQEAVHVTASLWNQDHTFTNAFLVEMTLEPDETWIAGDFNLTGSPDGNDFLVWQRNLGLPVDRVASFMYGDGDQDGDVDSFDLAVWESSPVAALRAVPEPSCLQLMLLALAAISPLAVMRLLLS